MAGTIKGITIQIGGDTTGLQQALQSTNNKIKDTQSELKKVERLLKLDPTNTEMLKQKQTLLAKSISETKNKLETLKKADEQFKNQANKDDESQERYRDLQREITKTEQALKELKKQASQTNVTMSKIGSVSSNIADKTRGLSITAGALLATVGTASFNAASDLNESLNKVDVAFGNSSNKIKEFSETTLESYGIAKGTALDMAALFGDMSTSMGISTRKSAEMSEKLVGLAGDLASFKNISLDTAETALKGIFTGETESLRNIGVVMTQTNLDAYALANSFGKVTKDMTESEKVQLRYQYVLEKTKNAQGDYKNTFDGAANSVKDMQESFKEAAAELGETLLPVVTPLINKISDLAQAFSKTSPELKKTTMVAVGLVASISPLAKTISTTTTAVSKAKTMLNGLSSSFKACSASATAFQSSAGALLATLAVVAATVGVIKKIREQRISEIEEEYALKIEKSNEYYENEIEKVEEEKEAYENTQQAKVDATNKAYDNKVENLSKEEKALKKALEREEKALDEAHDKRMKQLEEERDFKIRMVEESANKEIEALQAEIDNLDLLNEAMDKEAERESNAQKLVELQREIDSAKTYAEKLEAEEAYHNEVKKQEIEQTKTVREEQKKQLQAKINAIQDEADRKKEEIQNEYTAAKDLEESKTKVLKEELELREEALDDYVEEMTEKLNNMRDSEIAKIQDVTEKEADEYEKRIENLQKFKEDEEKILNDDKEEEIEKSKYPGLVEIYKRSQDIEVAPGKILPKNAKGTRDFGGGLTFVHEEGGELINLPQHTQIIPHDLSMAYVQELARQRASVTNNNYGARQQVTNLNIGGKTIAQVIQPNISQGLSNSQYSRRRAGYAK